MRHLSIVIAMGLLVVLGGPIQGDDVPTDELLIGCYRYVPGDCAGIYQVSPPFEPFIGGTLKRVVGGTRPVWSPDRTHFTYATNDVIWIANLGGERRGVGVRSPIDTSPGATCWSSDGRYIVCTKVAYRGAGPRGVRYSIVRAAAERIGRRNWEGVDPLLLPEGWGARWPAVSPDGRYLCWSEDNGPGQADATTICWAAWDDLCWGVGYSYPIRRMDEEAISRVPNLNRRRYERPRWSPDGNRIGLDAVDVRTGLRTAWVYDLKTDSIEEILCPFPRSEGVSAFFLGWLSDDVCLIGYGHFLARKVYRVCLSEKSSQQLFFDASTAIWDVAITPDRQRVAFIAGGMPTPPGAVHMLRMSTNVSTLDVRTGDYEMVFSNDEQLRGGDIRDRPLTPYCVAW